MSQVDIIQHLASVEEQERKLAIDRALSFQKAMNSGDVDTIYKAQKYFNQYNLRQQPARQDRMKSMILDPFEAASSMGYYSKAANLSYDTLRKMSRAPIIRAIINTRKDQVAEFCKPQPDKYSKGFVICKDGTDDPDELSDRDKKVIEKLTKFVLSCGDEANKWDLDDFEAFTRKIVEDSLTLDQATFEIIPTRSQEPTQFVAVDGATFRIADSYDNENGIRDSQKINGYYPSYVQLYQGQIIAEFYPWELCFGIRNPTTDIYANGYGKSELEDLILTVTAMLNADSYNGKFFRHGSAPKGALLVKKGNINKDAIAQLQRDWNAQMSGVNNMHKTPILDAESVEWLDMQKNNRDMEFSKYQEYLIKLGCAVYKISPEEIGFPLQGTNKGGLGKGDGGKDEKDYSISKGLKPLLTSIEGWVNKFILGPKTNYLYKFKFVGIQEGSAKEEEERLGKAVTEYMEINEVRKLKGLKPKPGYDIILNPIIAQQRQMQMQSQQEQQQKQEEDDQQETANKNPFLESGEEEDKNPFTKAYKSWVEENLIAA